jgi:hypothetical protein
MITLDRMAANPFDAREITPDRVYHFTDTARLAWIMTAGELRPSANRIGGYPAPEFVWATSDARGSPTAAGGASGYREGMTQLVRFTLPAGDFMPWTEIGARYPSWTPAERQRLESSARKRGDNPKTWFCRAEPLPIAAKTLIETKGYRDEAWREWRPRVLVVDPLGEGGAGVAIGDKLYLSRQLTDARGAVSYQVGEPIPAPTQAIAEIHRARQ